MLNYCISRATHPNDIALLKLVTPLRYTPTVKPISLPARDSPVDGDVILSGWGSIGSDGQTMPNTLRKVTLPIVSLDTCVNRWRSIKGNSVDINYSNVCAGPLSGGQAPCNVSFFSSLLEYI